MDATRYALELGPIGPTQVVVDGHDVTDLVESVNMLCRTGDVTRVGLALKPGADVQQLEGTGVVVAQPVATDVARWLANIDPDVLDKEVAENMGWGDDASMAKAVLARLKEMAGAE